MTYINLDHDEDQCKGPFDEAEIVDLIRSKAEKKLPAPHYRIEYEADWQFQGSNGNGRWCNGLIVTITRDMSEITFNLDFGNYHFDRTDLRRAARQSLKHLPLAIDQMMAQRAELTIHSASIGLILLAGESPSMRGWTAMHQHLAFPLSRRTRQAVNPYGIRDTRRHDDKLQWQVQWPHVNQMRLPGKRILPGEFKVGKHSAYNDHITLESRLPETVLTKAIGRPLHEIVDIPGFDHISTKIKHQRPWGKGSQLHFTSETINMEESFSLAARIQG